MSVHRTFSDISRRPRPTATDLPLPVVTRLATESPRLPLGRIRLHRQPTSPAGWNVTAHLSLATTEVRLTFWPAAPDDWPRLIHPTIHEVLGLCTALTIATAALDLSNQLAHY
ncbi:esterase [Streptomyces sp. NBC_00264]|uniref:esterase n=1 Tax=unclassified Streptomyces TaxID=2593676 RepID=UPI002258E87F|nr:MULTISPECIES: esterase [unclassified Streptomyces]MCX5163750.1 esterase [Streptomyces sp. NBC_00305]MCX5222273.1 esterase [Streptomyces sp. NBC_00264]